MTLPLSPAGRRYGAIKSDRNPAELGKPSFLFSAPPPPKFSIEKWQRGVKDQGDEGSCTGHGWTSNAEFLYYKFKGVDLTLSPAITYYLIREQEGTLSQGDCGGQVVTGANVLDLKGTSLLSVAPYTPGDFNTPPTPEQLADGMKHRTGAYHRLSTVTDIKQCIYSGYPITIGFTVYDSFEGRSIASDGLMPMPDTKKENILGGHCVFGGLAYDDSIECPGANPGAVRMQNSWGTGWADGGRFWMPYDFLCNPAFVSDIFIQHFGSAWRAF